MPNFYREFMVGENEQRKVLKVAMEHDYRNNSK